MYKGDTVKQESNLLSLGGPPEDVLTSPVECRERTVPSLMPRSFSRIPILMGRGTPTI